jgi:hypothetical protein
MNVNITYFVKLDTKILYIDLNRKRAVIQLLSSAALQ